MKAASIARRVSILAAAGIVGCADPLNVNIGEQNRGTAVGRVLGYSYTTSSWNAVVDEDVRLANAANVVTGTRYRARTNSEGKYLIEAPAGTYDVYACGYGRYGKGSVTVTRGSTSEVPDIKLNLTGLPCVIF